MAENDIASNAGTETSGATGETLQPAGSATAGNPSGERTFSQREFDENLGKRLGILRRQHEQQVQQLTQKFGFRDPSHMTAVQQKLSELNWTPEAWDEFVQAGTAEPAPERNEADQGRIRALERKMAEMELVTHQAQARAERLELERVVQVAAKEAVDPTVLAKLVSDQLRWNNGSVTVLGSDGQPNGQTLEEFIAETLTNYPFLRKSQIVATGSGSAGFGRPQPGQSVNGNVLDLSTPAKRVAAARAGIPQEIKNRLIR